jgi:hypothetical protein
MTRSHPLPKGDPRAVSARPLLSRERLEEEGDGVGVARRTKSLKASE